MANTAVLVGGYLVRTDNFTNMIYNHRSGYLISFKYHEKTYIHVEKVNYRRSDQDTKYATAGYYEENAFLSYRVKDLLIDQLENYKLEVEKLPKGVIGDKVVVQKLKIQAPYTSFCKANAISWNYDGSPLVDLKSFEIKIPENPAPDIEERDIPMHAVARDFYSRHTLFINTFFEVERESAAYLFTLCAIRINNIQRYIFPLFSNDPIFESYIASQNLEWTLGTIFNAPDLKDIENYFSNLSGFYQAIYANQKAIIKLKEMEKMYWFTYVLSAQSLTVMPAYDKINLLKYAALSDINQSSRLIELIRLLPIADLLIEPTLDNERFVLKIIESVVLAPLQGDGFLNYLLHPYYIDGKKKTTLFEVLYNRLDDNRIKAYSLGLLGDGDNRMKYIELIYNIWEKTSYNPYYKMPEYTQPPVFGGAYTESFFLKPPGNLYFDPDKAPPFIEYETGDLSDPTKLDSSFSTSFNYKIEDVKITVEKKVTTVKEFIQDNIDGTNNTSISSKTEYYGTYHLFQPVTISGFKSDLDIKFPTEKVVPIFYINYMVQYSAIKYLDFGIMLTAELALNFTGIGELQNLKYLGHLKYLSKMSSITSGEAVVTWAAVQGVSDAFVFTGANTAAVLNFMENTSTDPREVAAIKSANKYLGALLFSSLSTSYFLRGKVTQAALDFSYRLDELTAASIPYTLESSTEAVIRSLSGNEALVNSFTRNKLLQIPQGGTVVSVYDNSFTSAIKYKFGKDFGQRELDELALLKKKDAVPMNNYKRLAEKGLSEANSTPFLLETDRVNALIKYEEALVPELVYNIKLAGIEKRNAFLDYFPNPNNEIFNLFKGNPAKILEFHQADAQGRLMLRQNEYFWLKCGFDYEAIKGIEPMNITASRLYKNHISFTNPSLKADAIEILKEAGNFQKGDLVEIPMRGHLRRNITPNEEIYISIEIEFYKADKTPLLPRNFLELDGVKINKISGKIENPISAKLEEGTSYKQKLKDWTKLEIYKNMPISSIDAKNYIRSFNTPPFAQIKNSNKLDDLDYIMVRFTRLSDGKMDRMTLFDFKQKLKSNQYSSSDLIEISPTTLGLERNDLLESLYYRIIK